MARSICWRSAASLNSAAGTTDSRKAATSGDPEDASGCSAGAAGVAGGSGCTSCTAGGSSWAGAGGGSSIWLSGCGWGWGSGWACWGSKGGSGGSSIWGSGWACCGSKGGSGGSSIMGSGWVWDSPSACAICIRRVAYADPASTTADAENSASARMLAFMGISFIRSLRFNRSGTERTAAVHGSGCWRTGMAEVRADCDGRATSLNPG